MANVDWIKIKNEYITTDISQRELAKKYKVSFNTLKDRANREKWCADKKIVHNEIVKKTQQKAVEKISDKESSRIDRLLSMSDDMQEVLERAMLQITSYMTAPGLIEDFRFIDTHRLKRMTSALRDIKEVVCALEDIKNATTQQSGGGVVIIPEVKPLE